ncbi:MAG: cytochrome c [Thermodesulfovibrionia bacterium]|nr:cytochrome c [Thermodesulfovibrionia bacterium]MCK5426087.1 cytochrome c [Thermodesulfovibrionia bacterium]
MLNIYPIIAGAGIIISIISALKKSPFFNYIGILITIYGGLKSVEFFAPPFPGQIIVMYMAMSVFTFLIYFSIKEEQFKAFLRPMKSILADDNKKFPRVLIVYILIPAIAGFMSYDKVKPKLTPPVSARIVHPEPPTEIYFKGKKMRILGIKNPLRKDLYSLKTHVEDGKKIYFQNCFYCHGANLDGEGLFADVYNVRPLPFKGTDTIAQLPESFIFYRVAKGWKTLPSGSTPWDSSMPAFEDFLSEEDIWKVVLYIYEASGNVPRQ